MRWLLVLLVVMLQVQAPAMAQDPAPQMRDCHQMAPARTSDPRHHEPGKAQPVAHQCPGCSLPGVTLLVTPQPDVLAAPPLAARFTPLPSRSDPPSTPPPREA